MIKQSLKWNDKTIIKIDRFFPSSKMCSNCGWINQDLTLNIREWECKSCGEKHDRDFNASKNILKQGLKILSGSGIESDIPATPVVPPARTGYPFSDEPHLSQTTRISFSSALNSGSPVTSSAFFSFASAAAKASARLIGKRALKSAAVSAIWRVVE